MPRTKTGPKPQGLRVWEGNDANAPERIMSANELVASWRACQYADPKHDHSTECACPDRIPHQNFASIWNVANHIVICMGLGFDGEGGALARFMDSRAMDPLYNT